MPPPKPPQVTPAGNSHHSPRALEHNKRWMSSPTIAQAVHTEGVQADQNLPDSTWPADMQLRIDRPIDVLFLLFVRAAWRLPIAGVPEISPVPAPGTSSMPTHLQKADAIGAWWRDWARAWTRFAPVDRTVRQPSKQIEKILRNNSDDKLWEALSPHSRGPWEEGVDSDAFTVWRASLPHEHHLPLAQHPERLCIRDVVPAWQAGLRTIVELPYRDAFAHRLNEHTLVVATSTRQNPLRYRQALNMWAH